MRQNFYYASKKTTFNSIKINIHHTSVHHNGLMHTAYPYSFYSQSNDKRSVYIKKTSRRNIWAHLACSALSDFFFSPDPSTSIQDYTTILTFQCGGQRLQVPRKFKYSLWVNTNVTQYLITNHIENQMRNMLNYK